MTGILAAFTYFFSFGVVFLYYLVPWFVFATWLVVTTFLHHNEPGVLWFSNSNWNYTRGNLSSIDRDYGVFHWLTHSIGTHQVHHLFPIIPHYRLKEATAAFRKAFPELVSENNGYILPTFIENFQVFSKQQFIPADTEVFAYKKEEKKLK